MNCAECREAMLEADPGLLAVGGDDAVSVHLSGCAECRAVAATLGGSLRRARSAFEALTPASVANEVAARAMAGESQVIDIALGARRRSATVFTLKMASIAAAAAIVIVIADRRDDTVQRAAAGLVVQDTTSAAIAVEVPEGKNAIVFETKNPLISVVWIY